AGAPAQRAQLAAPLRELRQVAAAEPGKALGVVPVPAAQLVARREQLRPLVDRGIVAPEAPRPEPVHEHPESVASRRRLVGSLRAHFHPFERTSPLAAPPAARSTPPSAGPERAWRASSSLRGSRRRRRSSEAAAPRRRARRPRSSGR